MDSRPLQGLNNPDLDEHHILYLKYAIEIHT